MSTATAPAFDRVAEIAGAVGRRAGKRGEQVTRSHVLSSQGDTGDAQIGCHPGLCEPSAGTAPTCAANVDNGTPEPTLGRSAVGTDTTFPAADY